MNLFYKNNVYNYYKNVFEYFLFIRLISNFQNMYIK